eukprot:CCRYP_003095-RA/>CCRYP_003095-RA protein AED:0.22 eAED:0.22 QI:0/0/0/1/1/1/7/0/754
MLHSRRTGYALSSMLRRAIHTFSADRHVSFTSQTQVRHYDPQATAPMITFDSGADCHYLLETNRITAGLPILQPSSKQVSVANGGTRKAHHVSHLPFPQLSTNAALADSFDDFPQPLMSVGKTCDNSTIAIFTQAGVTVHKETDVLLTCRGKPLLIGARDNVWDMPSTEQAIKWMHAVCGYPVKSTWLKAVQAGNFIGWPLLTVCNIQKYFPETVETPKGHLNQSRKNVRSTKQKPIPLETFQSPQLTCRKLRDMYAHVYDTRNTIFSNQTVQYSSNQLKTASDSELTCAYSSLITRLHRSGVFPRKHLLDNEISNAMKTLITDKYKMTYELVPPGCHRRNAAEVAIRNSKSHFLSILAGVADNFPMKLWDQLLPQAEITINLLRQSNATLTVSAYAHLNGPFDYNKMPLALMWCKVQAIAACAAALKGITPPTQDITALKALLDITAATIKAPTEPHTSDSVPRRVNKEVYHDNWTTSSANEFGQLANGVEKKEPNCTRLVVGVNRINFPSEVATPTTDMLAAKILFNSVISTATACFMTMDISNFYLKTPLKCPEYIRMKFTDIPEEIIRNLMEPDECVYIMIVLGMYGLPHAGLIANKLLEKRLNKHGYHQSKLVPGLWKHKWGPIWFTLVVDNFGVKYVGKEHSLHLKSVLESYYPLSTDWTGNRYIRICLDWNYNNRKVHLSMPGYKAKALKQFQHKMPSEPQHSPFPTKPGKYGAKKQYATQESTASPFDKKGKKFIQQVCGKLLFLG